MSNLPSYNSATARLMSESDESISLRNNNVMSLEQQEIQQQRLQEQQQDKQQQQQQQQPQIPYHDPPYLIRNSRAFRHFRNPPQPHMCIKDHTDDGQELFINVMSWTKICMPNSEADPIPLYGGMRVSLKTILLFSTILPFSSVSCLFTLSKPRVVATQLNPLWLMRIKLFSITIGTHQAYQH